VLPLKDSTEMIAVCDIIRIRAKDVHASHN
jgi:hypothetical protein